MTWGSRHPNETTQIFRTHNPYRADMSKVGYVKRAIPKEVKRPGVTPKEAVLSWWSRVQATGVLMTSHEEGPWPEWVNIQDLTNEICRATGVYVSVAVIAREIQKLFPNIQKRGKGFRRIYRRTKTRRVAVFYNVGKFRPKPRAVHFHETP